MSLFSLSLREICAVKFSNPSDLKTYRTKSITFLNSLKLERKTFIPTISVYFMMMSVFQAPALIHYDFMNFEIFIISLICTGILIISMPIGNKIAKSVSIEMFDKIILMLLGFIALKIFYDFGVKYYL